MQSSLIHRSFKGNQDIQQLFRVLVGNVGVLQRPFFGFVNVLMHWDEVRAYDFKWDLTDGGNGNVSMAYTLVRRTMARQHNSCSDSTNKYMKNHKDYYFEPIEFGKVYEFTFI